MGVRRVDHLVAARRQLPAALSQSLQVETVVDQFEFPLVLQGSLDSKEPLVAFHVLHTPNSET
jgi:hypothetical protein